MQPPKQRGRPRKQAKSAPQPETQPRKQRGRPRKKAEKQLQAEEPQSINKAKKALTVPTSSTRTTRSSIKISSCIFFS